MERWEEDLSFDLAPGVMLWWVGWLVLLRRRWGREGTDSFLNILENFTS